MITTKGKQGRTDKLDAAVNWFVLSCLVASTSLVCLGQLRTEKTKAAAAPHAVQNTNAISKAVAARRNE